MKRLLVSLSVVACISAAFAQGRETFVYNVAGNDTLRLDLYRAHHVSVPAPAVIFAFGGGFACGERDNPEYMPMFQFLADNGVNVISVDYRTLLSDLDSETVSSPAAMTGRLYQAVSCAVTDFLTATRYVVGNSDQWNIDPSLIFASGSSAGAVTALQAEYTLCRESSGVPFLPEGFNYAGVISFAGAVAVAGDLDWPLKPAPMLLFHGDADRNVPFSAVTAGGMGLYGSEAISRSLSKIGVNHWFHRFNGADHVIAVSPMSRDRGEVFDFIRAVAEDRVDMVNTVEIVDFGDYETDFTIQDFIETNYAR